MSEGAQDRLSREVIEAGRCVMCGACVGLCPHFRFADGLVVRTDECDLSEGRCVELCPRTLDDPTSLLEPLGFEPPGPDDPGPTLSIGLFKAVSPAPGVQYGGVVTALTGLALTTGWVRGAVLTSKRGGSAPEGVVVRTPLSAESAAGSNFAGGATLAAFNRAVADRGLWPLAVVGLPCQVQALARLRTSDSPEMAEAKEALELVIGLFCTYNWPWRGVRRMLLGEGAPLDWDRSDIPPPPAEVFVIEKGGNRQDIPLEKLREIVMPGCMECTDMTAELSDISVGAAEGRPGWNTVIVRTPKGRRLLDQAVEQGLLETADVPPDSFEHLIRAVKNKRQRTGGQ